MAKLSEARRALANRFAEPMARLLSHTPITPSTLTWGGFLLTAGAAALIITEHLLAAGVVVLVGGLFDLLDGALARRTNRVTSFGSALDSTLDRLSDSVLLLGIIVLYAIEQSITGVALAGTALVSSLLVSYLRAKAEALGLECQVGLFTRAERVVILALGLLLSHISYVLIIALAITAAFSFITAGQRLIHIWRQTRTG